MNAQGKFISSTLKSWVSLTTEERIDAIKRAWYPQCSANDIAAQLSAEYGTITRNAVIGYYTRYGKELFHCPIQVPTQLKKKVASRRLRVAPPPALLTGEEKELPDLSFLLSSCGVRGLNVPIHALQRNQCRWPTNDAKYGEEHLFCGQDTGGRPYCRSHLEKSYACAGVDQ